ncbi:MAG: hypothetical protein AAFX50_25510, partial [Acidobacteriota bacterium]
MSEDFSTTQSIADVVRWRRFVAVLRPLHLTTVGYVLAYLTLWLVAHLGVVTVPAAAWKMGLGLMIVGQMAMSVAAYFYGESFRDWKVLGLATAVLAAAQFTVLTWWVPATAPVWMAAWLVNISHLASFSGWRQAAAAAA